MSRAEDQSNNSDEFVDINAVDSDSYSFPDDSSSFEGTSTSFFKSLTPKSEARPRRPKSTRHSIVSTDVTKQHSIIEEDLAETIDIEENVTELENRELLKTLMARQRYLKKLNSLLQKKAAGNKEFSDNNLVYMLLKGKAESFDSGAENSSMQFLLMEDESRRFSVLPLSHSLQLKRILRKRFSPFLHFKDSQVTLYEQYSERHIMFSLNCPKVLELNFEININSVDSSMKHFKVLNFNHMSINKADKKCLNTLIDNYFTVSQVFEISQHIECEKVGDKEWLLASGIRHQALQPTSLKSNDQLVYNLEMVDGKNIAYWFYALNAFLLSKAKRCYLLLRIIKHLSNYELHYKFQVSNDINDLIKDTIKRIQLLDTSANILANQQLPIDALLSLLGIPEDVSFDEYVQSIYNGTGYKKHHSKLIMLLMSFGGLDKLSIENDDIPFSMCITWDFEFNFQINDLAAQSEIDQFINDENHVRICEPSSIIRAFPVAKSMANIAYAEEVSIEDFNKTLLDLILRKGALDGMLLFIDNFFNIQRY